jgi:hypothetical protein
MISEENLAKVRAFASWACLEHLHLMSSSVSRQTSGASLTSRGTCRIRRPPSARSPSLRRSVYGLGRA